MRLLLDSHVLLWYDDPCKLTPADRRTIDNTSDVAVSVASIWELAIKQASGRLPFEKNLTEYAVSSGFDVLRITAEHAQTAAELPPHHRDPFDRMLVAQAMVEGLTLVTHDATLARYDVQTILV